MQITKGVFESLCDQEKVVLIESYQLYLKFVNLPFTFHGPLFTESVDEVKKGGLLVPTLHKIKRGDFLTIPELKVVRNVLQWRQWKVENDRKKAKVVRQILEKVTKWKQRGWFLLEEDEVELTGRVRVSEQKMFKNKKRSLRIMMSKLRKTPVCQIIY